MDNKDFKKLMDRLKNYTKIRIQDRFNTSEIKDDTCSFLDVDRIKKIVYLRAPDYEDVQLNLNRNQKLQFFKVFNAIYNTEKIKFIKKKL